LHGVASHSLSLPGLAAGEKEIRPLVLRKRRTASFAALIDLKALLSNIK